MYLSWCHQVPNTQAGKGVLSTFLRLDSVFLVQSRSFVKTFEHFSKAAHLASMLSLSNYSTTTFFYSLGLITYAFNSKIHGSRYLQCLSLDVFLLLFAWAAQSLYGKRSKFFRLLWISQIIWINQTICHFNLNMRAHWTYSGFNCKRSIKRKHEILTGETEFSRFCCVCEVYAFVCVKSIGEIFNVVEFNVVT